MKPLNPRLILMRVDFRFFVSWAFSVLNPGQRLEIEPYIEAIIQSAAPIISGEPDRLVVNCPPRVLKSLVFSIALPAFLLGKDPRTKILVASYGDGLAQDLHRQFRRLVEHPEYRRAFPRMRNDGTNTAMKFVTSREGLRQAITIGGTMTGIGGNVLIIDDPLKAQDSNSEVRRNEVNDWLSEVALTRFNDPARARIAIVAQRLHADDLSGRVLELGTYRHLKMPAQFSEATTFELPDGRRHTFKEGGFLSRRLSPAFLTDLRVSLGSRRYAAHFLQEPVPPGGNLFESEWIKRYRKAPNRSSDRIFQSWDIAAKEGVANDWSAVTTWQAHEGRVYLLDVQRVRKSFPRLIRFVHDYATEWDARTILIEDASSGIAIIQALEHDHRLNIIPIKVTEEKTVRAEAASLPMEAGKVLFPEELDATFEKEILAFPRGRNDDQVDSMVQFINYHFNTDADIPIVAPYIAYNPEPWTRIHGSGLDLDLDYE